MVLGANIIVGKMPTDYRWASPMETLVHETLVDAIQVKVGDDINYYWNAETKDAEYEIVPMTDIAVPASFPVMWDVREDGSVIDCFSEFDDHDDHTDCVYVMGLIHTDDYYDPMDDIPWGTPDSWIPDNPNEDGFCQSDFI